MESADACQLMLEAGAIPLDPYSGSTKNPWRSLCLKCNQEIAPRLANIKKGNGPCRRCAPNASVLPSVAESEMRAIGLTPLEPFQGVMTPWRCLCEMCGMEVTPRLNSIRKGYGCKGCARKGFKVGIPSIIYVIKHAGIRAVKVGVANRTSERLRSFESRGWISVRVDGVCCGAHAMGTETRVLREIRKTRRIPPLSIAKTVSLSGWTETSSLDDISVEELVSLVDLHEGARC